jgi:hypothetical protein
MIVFNKGSPQDTKVVIRLIDRIKADAKGNQTIDFKETQATLPEFFDKKYKFIQKHFMRLAPKRGVCE